jgi:hypothetical protein
MLAPLLFTTAHRGNKCGARTNWSPITHSFAIQLLDQLADRDADRGIGDRDTPSGHSHRISLRLLSEAPVSDDTIVTLRDIPVMYVAGEAGAPIGEQAPRAFKALEASLSTLKGRRFYGVVVDDEYRACVAIDSHDHVGARPHRTWTIPGGRYVRRRIPDWERRVEDIAPTCQALSRRADFDPSRYIIEYYRSQRELLVMVPVR